MSEVGPPYRGHDSPGSSSAFPRHLRERQGTVEHQPHWSVSQFPFGYRARMRRRCGETCARDSDPQECYLGPYGNYSQGIVSIGIHSSKYFWGPKNSSWGSESRGEP